jgi:SAM-dependent methyltransferase
VALHSAECAAAARLLYPTGPLFLAKMQHLRPYICPFDVLIEFVPDQARMLDVGCGAGLFLGLSATFRKGISGVGIDVSAQALEAARRMAETPASLRSGRMCLQFKRIAGPEPRPDTDFDVVSMIDVAHHVPPSSQRSFIESAATKVRPGGIFLYKDMCRQPLWRVVANRIHDLVVARQWIHELDTNLVKDWVCSLGFDLVHERRINRLWYGHELAVFRRASGPK